MNHSNPASEAGKQDVMFRELSAAESEAVSGGIVPRPTQGIDLRAREASER
jgi:hypothetical protein